MELNISAPTLRQGISNQELITKLNIYLQKLNGQLRYVLNNLEFSNFSGNTRQIILGETKDAVMAKLKDDSAFDKLKAQIIKTADFISDVETTLTNKLERDYMAKSDMGTYTENKVNEMFGSASGVQMLLTTVEAIDEQTRAYQGFIKVDTDPVDGIYLDVGTLDQSRFKTRITSDKIGFYESDDMVAWISNKELNITTARIDRLYIGDKSWLMETDSNDDLNIYWTGV